MRVLAIEDNRRFLDLMRSHLKKHGFTVDAAETLAEGVAMLSAGCHDVVLLDLSLPDGDGAQLIDQLRRERSPVPIIVLSAHGEISSRIGSLDSGADDYLVKPFDLEELVARIRAGARPGSCRKEEALEFADV